MPENIINILNQIRDAKGQPYVEGMVAMANLLSQAKAEEKKEG